MAWKRRKKMASAALILGIACIIGSMSLIAAEQVGQTLLEEDFEAYRTWPEDSHDWDCEGYPNPEAAIEAGWTFDASEAFPWQIVDECELFGMKANYPDLFPFASTIQAAYCGFVNPNTGTASYDGIEVPPIPVDPVLSTDFLEIEQDCSFIQASFDYWRQVEFYGDPNEYADVNGAVDVEDQTGTRLVYDDGSLKPVLETVANFDRTWVTVSFYTQTNSESIITGQTRLIWYKDSAWESNEEWISAGADVPIPDDAKFVQLSFHFEAFDNFGNDYVGWFVDNVGVNCYDNPPNICWDEDTPTILPQGIVGGEKYHVDFKKYLTEYLNDSTREVRFFVAKAGGRDCDCGFGTCTKLERNEDPYDMGLLPNRLTLSVDGILSGNITEDMVGMYTFWMLVEGESVRGENCACHEFHLTIRPDGDATGAIYESVFGSNPSEWFKCGDVIDCDVNLWKETGSVSGNLIPNPNGRMDPEFALYFGDNHADGANYDTGQRVIGCYCIDLTSYLCCSKSIGTEVELGFKQWREVENYSGGAYDKTWVELSVDGETWIPVIRGEADPDDLYWDSRDPSSTVWEWIQLKTGILILEEKRLLLRFCFDSVDGFDNDHLGWVIDEIAVWLNEPTLELENCPLPAGFVGEPYNLPLEYVNDIPVGSGARVDGLPLGLVCDGKQISGTPREEGDRSVTITVPEASPETCILTIHPQRCFFGEDFQDEYIWEPSTRLWQRVSAADFTSTQPPCDIDSIGIYSLNNHVVYFGQLPQANYSTGQREQGQLTYPTVFEVRADSYISLSFDSFLQVEQNLKGRYDQTSVQVWFGSSRSEEPGETGWQTVWYKDSSYVNSAGWTHEEANHGIAFLVPEGMTKMWVRFVFDSVDRWYNNYFGWMIDNVWICFAQEGEPIAGEDTYYNTSSTGAGRNSAAELSVMNYPNPVQDVHTTTFTVRGIGVEAIRIQIFDQNETLVFEQQVEGQELEWHTDNNYGEYLANGTYYYRAYARIDGEWIPTEFEKVVILR